MYINPLTCIGICSICDKAHWSDHDILIQINIQMIKTLMYIANLIQDIHLAALQHSNNNIIIIGGVGVRRVALLALPAFVASAASTLPLQDASLMNCACSNNSAFQNYLSL